ncbi:VOC family protein [Halomicrococcus sp. NG-SE-24]|uniref:VOC family protein n=1 Tax=Halomicrococcus sp. NG-SE-24 TaxID=3436928 RepID=UPI003D95E94C
MFDKVHHIAYTVDDLDAYKTLFGDTLSMGAVTTREMPDAGYKAAVYRVGETYIEVQEPIDHEEMETFLAEQGNGLNHVAYEVDDIDEAVATCERRGIKAAWDEPIVAPTFPDCRLIDMETETADGIYLQLIEEMTE